MTTVIAAVVVLGVLGAIFSLILAYASKAFAVEKDPREEAIAACLPGANCGGCGYPGCGGYAAAVVAGNAGTNCCAAGGDAVAAQIAEIMGVKASASARLVAQVQCTGGCRGHEQYNYVGIHDCCRCLPACPAEALRAAPSAAWALAPVSPCVPSMLSTWWTAWPRWTRKSARPVRSAWTCVPGTSSP